MTDAQIVKELAEKVMGWAALTPDDMDKQAPHLTLLQKSGFWIIGGPGLTYFDGVSPVRMWNPLDSDADCFMLVDAMKAKGWNYRLSECDGGTGHVTAARFWNRFGAMGGYLVEDPNRRRAIALAALAALAT